MVSTRQSDLLPPPILLPNDGRRVDVGVEGEDLKAREALREEVRKETKGGRECGMWQR